MSKKKTIVILDAGHGSNTAGKRSPDGKLREWAWNRTIVNGIKSSLEKNGIEVYLTHPEDLEMGGQSNDLVIRVNRANAKHAAAVKAGMTSIFVSIHIDAHGSGKEWTAARGLSCHIYTGASANSKRLAKTIYEEACKNGLKGNRSIPPCGYREGSLYVVRKTNMPAVLIENLFMTNKEDAAYLLSENGQQTIINSHVTAVIKYINA